MAAITSFPPGYMIRSELMVRDRKISLCYRLIRKLGEGGMAQVHLAEQMPTDGTVAMQKGKRVAIKFALAKNLNPDAVSNRFQLEGLISSRVDHPNVVSILDCGQDIATDIQFLVMEYIEGARELYQLRDSYVEDFYRQKKGDTLSGKIRTSMVPMSIVIQVATQLADVLVSLHAKGIIHRDLKPENILYTYANGVCRIHLLDFGIAKVVDPLIGIGGKHKMTLENEILGTPANMAPEQIKPREIAGESKPVSVGPWTDVYAAATVLFELITGQSVYDASNAYELMNRIVAEDVLPHQVEEFVSKPDAELVSLIKRCLEKNPRLRPTTKEFQERIADIAKRVEPTIHSIPIIDRPHVSIAPPSQRPTSPGDPMAETLAHSALRAPSLPNLQDLLIVPEAEDDSRHIPTEPPARTKREPSDEDIQLPVSKNRLPLIAVIAAILVVIPVAFLFLKSGNETDLTIKPASASVVASAPVAASSQVSIVSAAPSTPQTTVAPTPSAPPKLKPEAPPRTDASDKNVARDGRIYQRGLNLYKAGNCKLAQSAMRLVIDTYPNVPKLYLVTGECARKAGKKEDAITDLKKYLDFESTQPADLTPESRALLGL